MRLHFYMISVLLAVMLSSCDGDMSGLNGATFGGSEEGAKLNKNPNATPTPSPGAHKKNSDIIIDKSKKADNGIIEEDGIVRTGLIAVVFEDSTSINSQSGRDIRVCVKGNFGFETATRKIFGRVASGRQQIQVQAFKKPGAVCRHLFHLRVFNAQGQEIAHDSKETSTGAGYTNSNVFLSHGDELRLSWSRLGGSSCYISAPGGEDYHTRTVDNERPAPKIYKDECVDNWSR